MERKPATEVERKPRCPVCNGASHADGAHFPFCSERCKLVDLGRWLDGDYAIEVPMDMDDLEG